MNKTVENVMAWIGAFALVFVLFWLSTEDCRESDAQGEYQPSEQQRLPSVGEHMVTISEAPASEELPILIQADDMLTSLGHERFREHVRTHPAMMTIPPGVPVVILERRQGSHNTTFVRARTRETSIEYWTILAYLDYPSNR